MLQARQIAIQKLLDIPYQRIDRYHNSASPVRSDDCTTLTYSELIRKLEKIHLFPKRDSVQVLSSVDELAEQIQWTDTHFLTEDSYNNHIFCGVYDLTHSAIEAVKGISFPALD